MNQPNIDTTTLYAIIADTMPTEGRDFTIDVSTDANGKPWLAVQALTEVGRGFVPTLLERLRQPMQNRGVLIADKRTDAGAGSQEQITINLIRAQVEKEAAATVQAKLEATRKTLHDTEAEAEAAKQARIKQYGADALRTEDEVKTADAVKRVKHDLWRLEQIAERIPAVRARIDEAALNLAREDENSGQSWAVDMDAPLTTLFDKQDALTAFRRKEDLVQRMAMLDFDTSTLHLQAMSVTKRFIMNKPKHQEEAN